MVPLRPYILAILCLVLPGLLAHAADFTAAVTILQDRCADCHTGNAKKGGLSMNTRETLLAGTDGDSIVTPGDSKHSRFIEVLTLTDDDRMPPKGDALTTEQIDTLRAWVDAGMPWDKEFVFDKNKRASTAVHDVKLPATDTHPIDALLASYLREHNIPDGDIINDRAFARRVHLDLTGQLPSPPTLLEFLRDKSPDKREKLVQRVLADEIAYADHWLTFWNDALRNNYYGTGFIDNGRTQITAWLYDSLLRNKPYDQFARELISAAPGAEGYLKGIVWRGVVNASQRPVMQAAQNISQVFLGTNLKCASCHDSFIDAWKLDEAYAFANCFSDDGKLDVVRCDKPTGRMAGMAIPFPELGTVKADAPLAERRKQVAEAIASPKNGLFARTIVNRLWKNLFGYGLVESPDTMANKPWHPALLDWLANDLVSHGFDLKHTLSVICTSRAYQWSAVPNPKPEVMKDRAFQYVFRGPYVRRLTAEQLFDAVSTVLHVNRKPQGADAKGDKRGQGGQFLAIEKAQEKVLAEDNTLKTMHKAVPAALDVRASAMHENPFLSLLGRPNREQVVTMRDPLATTLQALELSNGTTFDALLKSGAQSWLRGDRARDAQLRKIYITALGRAPNAKEISVASEMLGETPTEEQMSDFLWSVLMLPEFQLIY
jgi:hypothetical protein